MNVRYFFLLALIVSAVPPAKSQSKHFLDCAAGSDNSDGLTSGSAWKTLARANQLQLRPGESLLIKRGTQCDGMLEPRGSGAPEKPVVLAAYGTGALPRIVATGQQAGIRLMDQQYWHIADLDVSGGSPYGIVISGTQPSLTHFRITDVVVHDVSGKPKTKDTGLLVFTHAPSAKTVFNDVVIDGVTAYNTTQWAGIIVTAGEYGKESLRGHDVVIRNAVVHDVAGDGILLSLAKGGLIEHSVAWATGMEPTQTIGTPNGIWEWECEDCTVQYNEGFLTDSPGVDGGVFDIDWGNINNLVQYNFAHDTQGYCVAVFGAEGSVGVSNNSIVRGNLCLDNGRSPREAQRQGAIYLSTWDGGKLNGVQIYGNTVYWDPPVDSAAVISDADIDASGPRTFHNNLIVSRVGNLVRSSGGLQFAANQYWVEGSVAPVWSFDGNRTGALSDAQRAGNEEQGSGYADPHMGLMYEPQSARCTGPGKLDRDVYGRRMPAECVNGAVAPKIVDTHISPVLGHLEGASSPFNWTLVAVLPAEGRMGTDTSQPDTRGPARSQLVVLQSMVQQFASLGLHVDIAPESDISASDASNWAADWNFGSVSLLEGRQAKAMRKPASASSVRLFLMHSGQVVRTWEGPVGAPELELTLRHLLGTPPGMQTLGH